MAIALVLTLSCLLFYLAFILRASWHFSRIICRKASRETLPFVSVVIPARNEAATIYDCLHSVLHQSYPRTAYEVILVNDHSTDETATIARSLQKQDPKLSVIDLQADGLNAFKKAALEKGISAARGEIILQTDADCLVPEEWIARMIAQFSEETVLVSGPVHLSYEKQFLQRLQSLESMGLVVLGAGSLAAGTPNMANGANLAYRKSAFESVGGFQGVDGVASGDDEFLLHKMHQAYPSRLVFAKCRGAIVTTAAQKDWNSLKAQRLRWVSKARAYQNRWINIVQLISYMGFLAFPLLLCYSFWNPWSLLAYLMIFGVKSLVDYVLMKQAAAFFHKLPLLRSLFLLELLYTPYVLWIGLAGNLISRYEWKGRSVK